MVCGDSKSKRQSPKENVTFCGQCLAVSCVAFNHQTWLVQSSIPFLIYLRVHTIYRLTVWCILLAFFQIRGTGGAYYHREPLVATWSNLAQEHPLWSILATALRSIPIYLFTCDFGKIGIGGPPRPPGGQFVLSVWEEPMVADLRKMLFEGP